jgi:AcrR family transcriptional regulator
MPGTSVVTIGAMGKPESRRRGDPEETRRRVLDAAVATVIDVGYYKASSNEIARRAGVTWGSIQHFFGSREQLMLDVVNDIGERLEHQLAASAVVGTTLEERLHSVLDTLAAHYAQPIYLVQVQILLDLSANPKVSTVGGGAVRRRSEHVPDRLARPLLAKALGELADEPDVAFYVFMTMRGYLVSCGIAQMITELPDGAVVRLIAGDTAGRADATARDLLVRGIAVTLREEGARRGRAVDPTGATVLPSDR